MSTGLLYSKPLPPIQTAPGLELLGSTHKLYTVREAKPFRMATGESMISSFKVYDKDGLHIFTAGQMQQPIFYKCPMWAVFFVVCAPKGEPIFTIAQRNSGCFAGSPLADPHLTQIYSKDRAMLSSYFCSDTEREKYLEDYADQLDDPETHVHLKLVKGSFIGHFWVDKTTVIILDGNQAPIMHLKETTIGWLDADHEQRSPDSLSDRSNDDQNDEENDHHDHEHDGLSSHGNSQAPSHAKSQAHSQAQSQAHSHAQSQANSQAQSQRHSHTHSKGVLGTNENGSVDMILHHLYGSSQADMLEELNHNQNNATDMHTEASRESRYKFEGINAKRENTMKKQELSTEPCNYELFEGNRIVGHIECLKSLQKLNITAKPQLCYGAVFPSDFTQVDKALVLGFILFKQRQVSHKSKICYVFLGILMIVVAVMTIIVVSFYLEDAIK